LPDKLVDWFVYRSLSKGNRHRPVWLFSGKAFDSQAVHV
jgi:hypothetical protein